MAVFITQGRFTSTAIKGMMENPEERAAAIRHLFEMSGGKLLNYYLTFGEYDFLVVSEGPYEGVAISSIVTSSSGAVTDLKTTLAMSAGEMKESFAKAAKLSASFKPAGMQR